MLILQERGGGESGSQLSPTAIGSCQVNLPIREPPITPSLIPLTEERAGRTKPGDPHIYNTLSLRVCVCLRVFASYVCVWAHLFASVCGYPLASLVSYTVSDYPMGALIETEAVLIVSLEEAAGGSTTTTAELPGGGERARQLLQSRGSRVSESRRRPLAAGFKTLTLCDRRYVCENSAVLT